MLPILGDFFAVSQDVSELPSDRRRAHRASIADTELTVRAFPMQVRLVDISLGGVLLESSHPVEPGTRGDLRFSFSGVPFSAAIRVERVDRSRETALERYSIGASFVELSREDQQVIERFSDQ